MNVFVDVPAKWSYLCICVWYKFVCLFIDSQVSSPTHITERKAEQNSSHNMYCFKHLHTLQFQNLAVWLFLRFCGPWCSPRTSDNAMACDVIQASPRRESVRGCGFSQRDWIPFSNVTSLFSAPSHHNIDNISVKQYSLIS